MGEDENHRRSSIPLLLVALCNGEQVTVTLVGDSHDTAKIIEVSDMSRFKQEKEVTSARWIIKG